jgi:excisionase family DNA binding protein
MSNNLLTLTEVSQKLAVTYPRVTDLVRRGVLPGVVRIGRQIRVNPEQLNEFIATGGQSLPGGWRRQAGESA